MAACDSRRDRERHTAEWNSSDRIWSLKHHRNYCSPSLSLCLSIYLSLSLSLSLSLFTLSGGIYFTMEVDIEPQGRVL